jgi:hypothetical protein
VLPQPPEHSVGPLLHRTVAGQRTAGRAGLLAQRQELVEDPV